MPIQSIPVVSVNILYRVSLPRQPRAALVAMLEVAVASSILDDEASPTGQQSDRAHALAAELEQLVISIDESQNDIASDVVATMHAMIQFCSSVAVGATPDMETDAVGEKRFPVTSAEHMLAASGVVCLCAQLLHASLPSHNTPRDMFRTTVDERPTVVQAATLLLSTLAAKHDAHAWFSGSGAIPALVAALGHGLSLIGYEDDASGRLLPPEEHGADGAVEPLAASALANLAWHDGVLGGSSAVAKEILHVGAVAPLVDTLVRGHLRSVQWAAAALCNLSMHGDKARAELTGTQLRTQPNHFAWPDISDGWC